MKWPGSLLVWTRQVTDSIAEPVGIPEMSYSNVARRRGKPRDSGTRITSATKSVVSSVETAPFVSA
jgi:hypothetical protein